MLITPIEISPLIVGKMPREYTIVATWGLAKIVKDTPLTRFAFKMP